MRRDEPAVIETSDFDAAIRGLTRDSVLIRPGAWLPPMAAQRLHWAARRAVGAATVSPIVDTLADADPFAPLPDRAQRDWSDWVRRVDACCAASSEFDPPLVDPSAHVLWVSKAAVDSAGGGGFLEATRAMRFGHLLADDVYVLAPDGAGNGSAAGAAHRGNVRRMLNAGAPAPSVDQRVRPRQLHVLHGWGGGAEQWVRDYCASDAGSENYVLTTECRSDGTAVRLCLYAKLGDPAALRTWPLDPVIDGTREEHAGYRGALAEALAFIAADRIIVSSLVGHSLDALRTGLPTLMVAHDYYPFCPVFNITFGGRTCTHCDAAELARCRRDNRLHDVFPGVPAPAWLGVRARFLADVERFDVQVVAPSESVRRNYARLAPALVPRIVSIPHGTPPAPAPLVRPADSGRLRVLVPGRMSEAKGKALFDALASEVASFADLVLLGCGAETAAAFTGRAGFTVVPSYPRESLPELLREHRPDVALLLSIVPETFSYTLQELFASAIAPVATRVGAFEDRIEDGASGFLCSPDAAALIARLRALAGDRAAILRVHETLRTRSVRSAHDMVRDYDGLRDDERSATAYYAGPPPALAAREAENSAQLFWRAVDGGFNEAESTRVVTPVSEKARTVRLRFPPVFPKLGGFRFDPGSRPGAVVLASMRLLDPEGAAAWTWDGTADVMDAASRSQIIPLGRPDDGPGQVLFLAGDDPHFGVALPAAVLAMLPAGGEFEVELRHPPVALFIERLLGHVKQEEARIAAEYQRQVDAHQELLRHERNRLMFVIESKESLLRQLMTALEGERGEVHALRGVTDSLRSEIVALRNSLSWKITAPLRRIAKPVMGA